LSSGGTPIMFGSITVGKEYVVAFSKSGDDYRTYLDGVLGMTITETSQPYNEISIFIDTNAQAMYLKDLRVWATELTPQQIATL
jgi:hypothetical protein